MQQEATIGKRSTFPRRARDDYPTPIEAVQPLLPHLKAGTRFCEPCAGNGALVDYLESVGLVCVDAWDIKTDREDFGIGDARCTVFQMDITDCVITNPPWERETLHMILGNLLKQCMPAWLLLDADWMHTRQAVPYLPSLRKIVSIGRVKWIPGTKSTGKDNCAWYLFDDINDGPTEFYGRTA